MRFGSVCSGIEAASVAWGPLGWKAAWLSEIEPFPSAVLAHHYPDVPNLGDMTALPERILSGEIEAPDLFCGGTPCQAFSVAGLRNSLDDARGNLSLTFVGIANAIDHVRVAGGSKPAIVFWENVPGVLSTKDNAFGCFLGALAGEDEPIIPPGEKWTNAGCVYGPQRTVAWRVLDAQYFGVAQRRRRVFVVASARADFDPAAVLFEFDGVRRDTAPSRQTGQNIAPCVTNGPPFSRTGNKQVEAGAMVVQPYEVGNCLTARMHKGINSTLDEGQTPVISIQDVRPVEKAQNGKGWNDDGTAYTVDTHATRGVAQPMPINTMVALRHEALGEGTGFGIGEPGDPAYTLTKGHSHAVAQVVGALACNTGPNGHDAGNFACNQAVDAGHVLPVTQPIAALPVGVTIHGTDKTARVASYTDIAGCLRADVPGRIENSSTTVVQQPIAFHPTQDPISSTDGTTHGLGCGSSGGQASVAVAQAVSENQRSELRLTDFTYAITSGGGKPGQGYPAALVPAHNYIGGVDYENNAHTMDQPTGPLLKGSPTGGGRPLPAIATDMQVRRLTPVECERLQGFPDGYTNIPWRKKDESPDGPRYKALGNSWAVPNVRWIGKRIQEQICSASP